MAQVDKADRDAIEAIPTVTAITPASTDQVLLTRPSTGEDVLVGFSDFAAAVTGGGSLSYDGGSPGSSYTIILDGGAPGDGYTLVVDGGGAGGPTTTARIRVRRGTTEEWYAAPDTLLDGELAVARDTGELRAGKESAWSSSWQLLYRPITQALYEKLISVENGATADMTGAELVTALNAQLGSTGWQASLPAQVSSPEKTAGSETNTRLFSPRDVADMAATFGGGGGGVALPAQISSTERSQLNVTELRSFAPSDLGAMGMTQAQITARSSTTPRLLAPANVQYFRVPSGSISDSAVTISYMWAPADIAAAIAAAGGGGGGGSVPFDLQFLLPVTANVTALQIGRGLSVATRIASVFAQTEGGTCTLAIQRESSAGVMSAVTPAPGPITTTTGVIPADAAQNLIAYGRIKITVTSAVALTGLTIILTLVAA